MAEFALRSPAGWRDDSLGRLAIVAPAVAAGWLLILWTLGLLLAREPISPAPTAIDATLIELPGEPERAPESPAPASAPKPRRVQPPPVVRPVRPEPTPEEPAASAEPTQRPESSPRPPPTAAPLPQAQLSRQGAAQVARTAARAIFNPLPRIPDELRERASAAEALARFEIRADGTVSVELVKPTPDPLLNRVILETLRTWRFFPAMENGRPIASTQEVRVSMEVR